MPDLTPSDDAAKPPSPAEPPSPRPTVGQLYPHLVDVPDLAHLAGVEVPTARKRTATRAATSPSRRVLIATFSAS